MVKVGINGFGRIGRLILRAILENYKNKILKETNYKISIEAGRSDSWSKFIGDGGMSFGIENFGKSAPYKDIYDNFELNSESIIKKIKQKI